MHFYKDAPYVAFIYLTSLGSIDVGGREGVIM